MTAKPRKTGVGAALEAWLPKKMTGAAGVRAEVARRLAAEIDSVDLPPYTVARLGAALGHVVAELESVESTWSHDRVQSLLGELPSGR